MAGCRVRSVIAAVSVAGVVAVGPADATTSLTWNVTGWNMTKVQLDNRALADFYFNTPRAYAIGDESGVQNQVPSGLAATPTLKYESYAAFQSDVSSGRISSSIRAVIYDPENWSATPDAERRDPATYMRLFAQLAHGYGYYVTMTPSRDLMLATGAVCGKLAGEALSSAFIRCNVAGAAAQYADAYEAQSQVHENDPSTFRWFVQSTASQARNANPRIVFLAGLATSPGGYVATPTMLYNAHVAVRDVVAGYYFTINSADLSIAEQFLQLLAT